MTDGLSVEIEHRQGAFRLSGSFAAPGGVTALFGRSGSGKTTLVNIIGGLVRPGRGRVVVGGTTLVDTERGVFVPRHKRRIGYVFQEGRLFPHLNVRQNLLFGRWFAGRAARGDDVGFVTDLLGLDPLLTRGPGTLSGGEKQRVAIGRALLADPRLLLLDEPMAALDEARKAEILPYIEELRDKAGVPIVYVSHSIAEVARLADTIVVLDAGRVSTSGPASEILSSLELGPLTGAREAGAVLDARIASHDASFGLTTLSTRAGDLHVPRIGLPTGARLRIQVYARDVMLSLTRPDGLSALNALPGVIDTIPPSGFVDGNPMVELRLDCNGVLLLARLTRKSLADLALTPGTQVFAVVKSVAFDLRLTARSRLDGDDGVSS